MKPVSRVVLPVLGESVHKKCPWIFMQVSQLEYRPLRNIFDRLYGLNVLRSGQ